MSCLFGKGGYPYTSWTSTYFTLFKVDSLNSHFTWVELLLVFTKDFSLGYLVFQAYNLKNFLISVPSGDPSFWQKPLSYNVFISKWTTWIPDDGNISFGQVFTGLVTIRESSSRNWQMIWQYYINMWKQCKIVYILFSDFHCLSESRALTPSNTKLFTEWTPSLAQFVCSLATLGSLLSKATIIP